MGDDEPDVAEAFADPAACGLAAALLLLLSVLVAVAGGRGADTAVVAVDLEFELKQPPEVFEVRFTRNGADLCTVTGRVKEGKASGEAEPGEELAGDASAHRVDLFRNQAASFRTPLARRPAVGFTADPLRREQDKPDEGAWRAWRVGVLVQFPGRPQAVEVRCKYAGDFVPRKVTVRGAVQGAAGEPPPPVTYVPPPGSAGFRVQMARGEPSVSPD